MSTTVDNRVVSMRFDNEEFEKKATKSISTLEKLKNALNFSGASKDLDDVNESFKEVDANPLLNAISGVNSGFATMIAKATIVNRAVNALIDTTTNFVKSLSVDQINNGWDKYADKTAAVQTIMAATAKDFSDTGQQMAFVNEQLDKLNWFTDETSYNFTDMVSNIGKFTSNGIKLDKSVTAMQGIATWAAVSGANANEASRAMYNLSQALSTGAVKLIDWKSIENANMATVEFKETVISAAEELGTLKKTGDGLYETMKGNAVSVTNFNEALSDAWFTSDVLMTALDRYGAFTDKLYEVSEVTDRTATQLLADIEKYQNGTLDLATYAEECEMSIEDVASMMEELSDETYALGKKSFRAAQEAKTLTEAINATTDAVSTGWMKSFEIIFGDYEEAKKLWTSVANIMYEVFAASGDIRNELLSDWREGGGRVTLLEGINNLMEAILRLVTPFKDAFRDIFPETTGKDLLNLTNKFKSFTEVLKLNTKQMTNLRKIARGVFSVLDLILTTAKSLASAVGGALSSALGFVGDDILDLLGYLGDFVTYATQMAKQTGVMSKVFAVIADGSSNVVKILSTLINKFRQSTVGQTTFSILATVLSKSVNFAGKLASYIGSVVSGLAMLNSFTFDNVLSILTGSFDNIFGISDDLSLEVKDSKGVLSGFQTSIQNACEKVGISFSNLSSRVTTTFEILRGWLEDVPWAQLIAIGFGIAIINTINKTVTQLTNLTTAVANLTKGFTGIVGSLDKVATSIAGTFNAITNAIKTPNYLKVAQAIALVAASVFALALVDTTKLWNATEALVATMGAFVIMTELLARLPATATASFAAVGVLSKTIIVLAASIWLLSKAFKSLEELDPDAIISSTVVLSITIYALAKAANYMSSGLSRISDSSGNIKYANTAAKNMLAMAASIFIIAKALESIADLHFVDPTSSLIALGAAVASVIAITLSLSKIKGTAGIQGASALLAACLSIWAVMEAIKDLSEVPIDSYMAGLGRAFGLIALMGTFFLVTRAAGQNAAKAGALMLGIGVAIYAIIGAIALLGSIKKETLEKGVNAIGYLTIIFMGLMVASNLVGENAHKMSVTLLAAATAFTVCGVVVAILGSIKTETLQKGTLVLIAIGSMFAALIAATGLAKNVGKDITLLTTMIVAIGVMLAAMTMITDTTAIKDAAVAITMVMAAMAAVLAVTKIASMSKEVAGAMAGALVFLAAAAAVLWFLDHNIENPSNAIIISEALIKFAAVFSALVVVFAGVAKLLGQTQISFLSMAKIAGIVLASIAAVLIAIGGISALIGGIPDTLASDCEKVGEAIGALVGGLVGGLAGGALTALGHGLAAFSAAMDGVDTEKLKAGLNCLVDAAIGMAAASVGGLVALLGAIGVATFPAQMLLLGEGIYNYGYAIEGVNVSAIESSLPAVTALVAIANEIPTSGGIFNLFTGQHDFGKFGAQLAVFGGALCLYSLSLTGCDFNLISASLEPVRALVEIGNTLPLSQSLFGLFFGAHDFAAFGLQLASFGAGLKWYSREIKSADFELINKSIEPVKAIVAIGNALPKSPSLFSIFFGSHNFDTFGEQLASFGGSFKKYYKEIKGVDFEKMNASIDGARALVEIANMIPNDNFFDWLIGNDSIDDFGKKLKSFGAGMASYYKEVSGVKMDTIGNSATLVDQVMLIAESIPKLEGYDLTALSTWGKNLKEFGSNLTTFFYDMAVVAQVSALGPLCSSIYTSLTTIQGYVVKFEQAGRDCADGLVVGLSDISTLYKIEQAGKTLGTKFLNAFKDETEWGSPWGTMIQAGEDAAIGLSKGVGKGKGAGDAGALLGANFLDGFRDETGWHSPWDTMVQAIKDCVGGVWEGIKSKKKEIDDAGGLLGGGLGDATIEAADGTIMNGLGKVIDTANEYASKAGEFVGNTFLGEMALDTSETDAYAEDLTKTMEEMVASATGDSLGTFSSCGTTAADAFLTALEDELTGYDLDLSTIDLEQELWEATIGKTATDSEATARETANLTSKIAIQNEKVRVATEKYEYTMEKFGETSQDAKQAYQDLLQAQIDLASLMEEINSLNTAASDNSADAMVAYAKWVSESQEDLLKLGFTMEEISQAAQDATGYHLNNTTDSMTDTVSDAVTNAMSTVATTYANTAESTLGALTSNFTEYGASYASAIGTGMATNAYAVSSGAKSSTTDALTVMSDTYIQWYNVGAYLSEGFRLGIESKRESIVTTAQSIANAALAIIQSATAVMSPSRKTMWIGEMVGLGFAMGMDNMGHTIETSASGISEGAINAAKSAIDQIASVLDADAALHPEITPVLNLDGVKNGVRGVSASLGTATLNTRVANMQVNGVAASIGSGQNSINQTDTASGQNGSQSFSFVQNNYSPKALSRAEIYRNTNNQFSAFKEAVSKA